MYKSGATSVASVMPEAGKVYSFMNCDTGRKLCAAGVTEFVLVQEGEKFLLLSGSYYLDPVDGGRLRAEKTPLGIDALKNSRFRLTYGDKALSDDDKGDAPLVSLALSDKPENIECCWYITETGGVEPLRIMPMGDSITYGYCADVPENECVGCRPELADMIAADPLSRFVFVGSCKEHESLADETVYYRHEGHGGWMGDDIFRANPESRGLIDYLDYYMGKYRPDVVLTQVGTNDCAFTAGRSMYEEEPFTDESMGELKARWRRYIEKVWRMLSYNGAVVIATVPPTTRTQCFDDWINEFNKEMPLAVERFKAAGRRAAFADTNRMISASTPERGVCSDMVHLSLKGYTAMATALYNGFREIFPGTVGR